MHLFRTLPAMVASGVLVHRGVWVAPLRPGDVARATEMEALAYPADEAATPEALAYRAEHAASFFYGCYATPRPAGTATGSGPGPLVPELVGYVCGTCVAGGGGGAVTAESMAAGGHVPDGELLDVHSVVVTPDLQRRGLATAMLRAYFAAVAADPACANVKTVGLLAKPKHVGLYANLGFHPHGESACDHGSETWWDMSAPLAVVAAPRYHVVDAFVTDAPFSGNPAAVMFVDSLRGRSDGADGAAWRQACAAEMNLSETAFVWPSHGAPENAAFSQGDASPPTFSLCWYTPTVEVDLCGHATCASAHALWFSGAVPGDKAIRFITKSGMLEASRSADGAVSLDFPADFPLPLEPEDANEDALKVAVAGGIGLAPDRIETVCRGVDDVLALVSEDDFARLAPDMGKLSAIATRGVVVTAPGAAGGVDFVSRWFGPLVGVPEDPVTGSAHCLLAPFWLERLGVDRPLRARQASARGGDLTVRLSEDKRRVRLSGRAWATAAGRWLTGV